MGRVSGRKRSGQGILPLPHCRDCSNIRGVEIYNNTRGNENEWPSNGI